MPGHGFLPWPSTSEARLRGTNARTADISGPCLRAGRRIQNHFSGHRRTRRQNDHPRGVFEHVAARSRVALRAQLAHGHLAGELPAPRHCSNYDRRLVEAKVECGMSIERDNAVERQVRVDRMIEEFREAQARRRANLNDMVVEPKADAHPKAPLTGSSTSQ